MLLKSLDILKGLWYNGIVEERVRAMGGGFDTNVWQNGVVGLRKVLPQERAEEDC